MLDLLSADVGRRRRSAWVCCDDCHKWRRISAILADSIESTECRWYDFIFFQISTYDITIDLCLNTSNFITWIKPIFPYFLSFQVKIDEHCEICLLESKGKMVI